MNTLSAIARQRKIALGLNIPRGHAKDAEKGRQTFERHLKRSAKIVKKWPAWKRSVLGRDPLLQALDDGEEFVRRSQSTT